MKIAKHNTEQLKQFALMMSWAFPTMFSLLLPWLFGYALQYWPLAISVFFIGLWALKPQWIYYPYKVWMTIAGVIGWINTRVILAMCFYLLIFPVGVIMRLLGKLDYQGKIVSTKTSNYHMAKTKSDKNNLENPF